MLAHHLDRPIALAALALLTACAGSLRPIPVEAPPPSDVEVKLWVTGSSNVRRFRCQATDVGLHVHRTPGGPLLDLDDRTPYAVLHVPAAGLDCGIALMNQHLRESLHAEAAPVITFRLLRVTRASGRSADSATFHLIGSLHLAGRERAVEIAARHVRDASGRTVIEGDHDIDVRDFGIDPPRRFGGLLRVRSRVTVHYTLALPDGA
jgi:hypothetical protein